MNDIFRLTYHIGVQHNPLNPCTLIRATHNANDMRDLNECYRAPSSPNQRSHRIDKFSFGNPQGGIVQPLEGDEKIANKSE